MRLQDGLPLPLIINLGDLSILKERGSEWSKFLDLLNEGNRIRAKDAGVLVVIISRKNFEYNEKPSITHQFDAGAAWENLALEASIRGIVGDMECKDLTIKKLEQNLNIPDNFDVMAMIAIGKKEDLSKNYLQSYNRSNTLTTESH